MALRDSVQHLNEVHKTSSHKSQYLHLVFTREIDFVELNMQVKLFLLELMMEKDPSVSLFWSMSVEFCLFGGRLLVCLFVCLVLFVCLAN